jgi:hypothetical protein
MAKVPLNEAVEILNRRRQHLANRIASADFPQELSFDRAEHGAISTVLQFIERERNGNTRRPDEKRARR